MTVVPFAADLPGGITLQCRAAGSEEAPLLLFLHGFPEAAFIWDGLLEHFAPNYRCVAPNLRGFAGSTAPEEIESYRARHILADLTALIAQLGGRAAAVISHDWGGAVGWALAAQHPELLERLVVINSPHPATFLRELRENPVQQAASTYMHFLSRPDAAERLAENDFARLWGFFGGPGAGTAPAWLTPALQERYREVWRLGLAGPCQYYAASPLRPPRGADDPLMSLQLPDSLTHVGIPTHVVWGMDDWALPPALLDGLDAYVPKLTVRRVPDASHWIMHERPHLIATEIARALAA
jgi:epoxide hydrolase 4